MANRFLSGRRVLVVEDETLILMMIEDMLSDLGCESIATAATIDKALAIIDGQNFDAAMLDRNMSGHASHLVAEALVARGVPFIYCTGNNSGTSGDAYPERPILKKPFQHKQLVEILTRLLSP